MKLEAKLDAGHSVSVALVPGGYADAGSTKSGDLAGLEVAIQSERGLIVNQPQPRYATSDPVLSISGTRDGLLAIAFLIYDKLSNAPAFNEREWRTIAQALRDSSVLIGDRAVGDDDEIGRAIAANDSIADRIDAAYTPKGDAS